MTFGKDKRGRRMNVFRPWWPDQERVPEPMPHLRDGRMPAAPRREEPRARRMMAVSSWSSAWWARARRGTRARVIASKRTL